MPKTFSGLALCMGLMGAALLGTAACGSTDEDPKGGAGTSGNTAQGGRTGSSGGATGSGGSLSSSGGKSSGGASSTAGRSNSGGDTSNAGSTGSGDTRPLNELTEEELDDVCREQASRIDTPELKEQNCRIFGILGALSSETMDFAELPAICQPIYEQCKESEVSTDLTCSEDLSECSATVEEFEACFNAFPAWIGAQDVPACEELDPLTLITLLAAAQNLPDECTPLRTKCPEALPVPAAGAGAP